MNIFENFGSVKNVYLIQGTQPTRTNQDTGSFWQIEKYDDEHLRFAMVNYSSGNKEIVPHVSYGKLNFFHKLNIE